MAMWGIKRKSMRMKKMIIATLAIMLVNKADTLTAYSTKWRREETAREC